MNESTLIEFVREFDPVLAPLLPPLRDGAEALAESGDQEIERSVVPVVRDVANQAGRLLQKVKEQQTFVLVFGPLKSGKSTLMNALAAIYVSEVTALPAYPCMVYVSHAATSSYAITRYDGTTEVLRDTAALQQLVSDAHIDLARELDAAEARGEVFDPGEHFPPALRRIDVRLPAEELRASGAVLVDTPGLYTRMKFGYDAMTRDFRHAAACAVFVVKTDNLFLEQVFAEFEDLLDLFSRIFLVVNVDPGKQDLGPNGELIPSAEAGNPASVVNAFRTFSMTPRMRAACEEGRLHIHTVDLLSAARRRLRNEDEEAGDPAGFEALRTDLLEFLSSSEYLVTFVRDSIRQGQALLFRLDAALANRALTEIAERLEVDRGELHDARERHEALERATAHDWDRSLADFSAAVQGEVKSDFPAAREQATKRLQESLDQWFDTDESLKRLTEPRASGWLTGHLHQCEEDVRRAVRRVVERGRVGLDLPGLVLDDLERVEIDLDSLSLDLSAEPGPAAEGLRLDQDAIPVSRTFWDWVLLRTKHRIRRRLFGPSERPDFTLDAETKRDRLGTAGQEGLMIALRHGTDAVYPRQEAAAHERLTSAHRTTFLAQLHASFDTRRRSLDLQISGLAERVRLAEGVLQPVGVLRGEVEKTRDAFDALHEHFFPAPVIEAESEPEEDEADEEEFLILDEMPNEDESDEEGPDADDGDGDDASGEEISELTPTPAPIEDLPEVNEDSQEILRGQVRDEASEESGEIESGSH